MAAAAAQLTGKPQIVLATRTVGAANAAIGIHTARQDSAPLVALIGGRPARVPGSRGVPGVGLRDRHRFAGRLVGGAGATHGREPRHGGGDPSADDAVDPVRSCWHCPRTCSTSPQAARQPDPSHPAQGAAPDRAAVRQVLKWLAASRRGVIVAGGGVLRARASKRLTDPRRRARGARHRVLASGRCGAQ